MAHPSALERLKELAKADREAAQGFYIVCGKPAVEDFDPVWEKEDPEWFERHQELLFIIALMEAGAPTAQAELSADEATELALLREYRNACIGFNNSMGAETETLEEGVELERKAEARLEAAEKACWQFYAGRKQAPSLPVECRQRLAKEGKPYPKSSCAVCGQFSPKWKECDALLTDHGQGEKV